MPTAMKPIDLGGSLELCSWLDNVMFAPAASAHKDLHKTQHNTVEDVWFKGNRVPMRILHRGHVEHNEGLGDWCVRRA